MNAKNKSIYVYDYVNKHCDAYNDGKISPSRMVRVVVKDVVHINNLSKYYWNLWKKTVRQEIEEARSGIAIYHTSDGVYLHGIDLNCENFIFAQILGEDYSSKDAEEIMFAKMIGGGWYSINYNYLLDLDNEGRAKNIKNWRKCAAAMGEKMVLNKETELYDYIKVK